LRSAFSVVDRGPWIAEWHHRHLDRGLPSFVEERLRVGNVALVDVKAADHVDVRSEVNV